MFCSSTDTVAPVGPGPLCSTERERSGVDGDAVIVPEQPRTSTSTAYHSEESPAAVASTSTSAPAAPPTFERPPPGLVRQVTFGVQTEFSPANLPDLVLQSDDESANIRNEMSKSICCQLIAQDGYSSWIALRCRNGLFPFTERAIVFRSFGYLTFPSQSTTLYNGSIGLFFPPKHAFLTNINELSVIVNILFWVKRNGK